MNDSDDPRSVSVEGATAAGGQPATPPPVGDSSSPPLVTHRPAAEVIEARAEEPADRSFENLELLSRFLMGAVLLGGDELMQRLRYLQREIEADPALLRSKGGIGDETNRDLLRYLVIGLLWRGQQRIGRGIRDGIHLSLGTATWFLRRLNRLSDNRFTRPIRRPIESRVEELGQEMDLLIREGRLVERNSRLLAGETVSEIIDDVLDFVGESPDLNQAIQQIIGKQSIGLAGVVGDNARRVSVAADNVAEGVVRRLLGRQPRRELPPSPLKGKPQTMYSLESEEWETVENGR